MRASHPGSFLIFAGTALRKGYLQIAFENYPALRLMFPVQPGRVSGAPVVDGDVLLSL
jgi:hypothetical protein